MLDWLPFLSQAQLSPSLPLLIIPRVQRQLLLLPLSSCRISIDVVAAGVVLFELSVRGLVHEHQCNSLFAATRVKVISNFAKKEKEKKNSIMRGRLPQVPQDPAQLLFLVLATFSSKPFGTLYFFLNLKFS